MSYERRTQAKLEQAVRDILGHLLDEPAAIRFSDSAAPLRRRAIVKNIDLAAKHYDLRQEVDAFLAERDCASVAGLNDRELRALSRWLDGVMERLSTCCDHPDFPSAR